MDKQGYRVRRVEQKNGSVDFFVDIKQAGAWFPVDGYRTKEAAIRVINRFLGFQVVSDEVIYTTEDEPCQR